MGSQAHFAIYASDDNLTQLVTKTHAAFIMAGYLFAMPGQSRPVPQGERLTGFYTQAGRPDLLFAAETLPDPSRVTTASALAPGMDAMSMQEILKQARGKKSAITIISAPNLLTRMLGGF